MVGTAVRTEIFGGVARLPQEMASGEPSSYLAIEVEVDMESGLVVSAACTAVPTLVEGLIISLLEGQRADTALMSISKELEQRYHGSAKRA